MCNAIKKQCPRDSYVYLFNFLSEDFLSGIAYVKKLKIICTYEFL